MIGRNGNGMHSEGGSRMLDTVIRGGRVLGHAGARATCIGVSEGKIVSLADELAGQRIIDADGLWILPGVIDGHTHMEAPAFGMLSRDTFETGTIAAAAGGVTTVVDFTVGDRDTSLAEQIASRRRAARHSAVDYAFHAEIVGWRPGRAEEVLQAVDQGTTSFKFYMVYDERSDHAELLDAFRAIAAAGGVAMVHAEDHEIVEASRAAVLTWEPSTMADFGRSRPAISESLAIEVICHLAAQTGVRVHIAHVSTAGGCDVIRRAKARGIDITAETCPHYLLLDQAAYGRPDGRQFAVVPPLRTEEDREALWAALEDGTLDMIATDHCPFLVRDKRKPEHVLDVPCGLPGVETLLPLVHSEGVVRRGLSMEWLVSHLSSNPAQRFGLAPAKGQIAVGADADLVLFAPEKNWTAAAASLHMATDFSPYEGLELRGAVHATLLRGQVIWSDGRYRGQPGGGRFVS